MKISGILLICATLFAGCGSQSDQTSGESPSGSVDGAATGTISQSGNQSGSGSTNASGAGAPTQEGRTGEQSSPPRDGVGGKGSTSG